MARIAVLFLAACALHAQSIELAFTNSVTRAPIAELTVTLRGPVEFTATTDGAGIARIPNAPPGLYVLGFKTGGYRPPLATSKPIRVVNDPVRLAFEMTPYGRLQGRVLLPDGAPSRGARVMLLPYRRGGGPMTTTDGEGRFTITGIFPGRYALAAVPPGRRTPPDGEAWAPAWFPNAPDRAASQPIVLGPGADGSGYDIRLRSVPVRRVRGVVRDDRGMPAPGASVQFLDASGPLSISGFISVTDENGAFNAGDLRAGEWRIVATLTRDGVPLKAVEPLSLSRRDLDGVDLRLARPFTLEASVERDELKPATAVSLLPEPSRPEFQVLAFHDEDGAALLKNVYPGRYEIAPVGGVPGYYLESVRLGETDVLGKTVEIFEGVPPIRVVYQSGAPAVRARVENGEGARVVLVPRQDALMTDQFIRAAAVGDDGRCEVAGLRPGDYYAFAFDRYEMAALADPLFVRALVPRAEKVHVEKGEAASVSLKVTPWPE